MKKIFFEVTAQSKIFQVHFERLIAMHFNEILFSVVLPTLALGESCRDELSQTPYGWINIHLKESENQRINSTFKIKTLTSDYKTETVSHWHNNTPYILP